MSEVSVQPPGKVLVVDDSRMVRLSILKSIRSQHAVREEADGESAWQALVVDPQIRLVITDIGMPGLDGYGLIERIRSSKLARIRDLPVVVISGEEDEDARARARAAGATDFISKGIGTTELLARLDALSDLSATRSELEQSRKVLAAASPPAALVDPESNLPTQAFFEARGRQEAAAAARHETCISVVVLEIDRYDALVTQLGDRVARLVVRNLSRVMGDKLRAEDTVSQVAAARFIVLAPHTDMARCWIFTKRLVQAVEKMVFTYHEHRIAISLSVGLSSTELDGQGAVSHLIHLATTRMQLGQLAGGSRVVFDDQDPNGEREPEQVMALRAAPKSIDALLRRLASGSRPPNAAELRAATATLLPLLELIESEGSLGLPLNRLRAFADSASGNTQ